MVKMLVSVTTVLRAVVTRDVVSEGEASRALVAALQRAVGEREAEVGRLEAEVARAAGELEQAAAIVQGMKEGGGRGGDPLQRSLVAVRAELYEAKQQVGTHLHLPPLHLPPLYLPPLHLPPPATRWASCRSRCRRRRRRPGTRRRS